MLNFISNAVYKITTYLDQIDFTATDIDTVKNLFCSRGDIIAKSLTEQQALNLILDTKIAQKLFPEEVQSFNDFSASLLAGDYKAEKEYDQHELTQTLRAQIEHEDSMKIGYIMNFMASYDEKLDGAISLVCYDDDTLESKDGYKLISENAIDNLKHCIIKGQCKPDSLRLVNDDVFALDFEQYGYFFKRNCAHLYEPLQAIFTNIQALAHKMTIVRNNTHPDIRYIIGRFVEFLQRDVSCALAANIDTLYHELYTALVCQYNGQAVDYQRITNKISEYDVNYPLLTEQLIKGIVCPLNSKQRIEDYALELKRLLMAGCDFSQVTEQIEVEWELARRLADCKLAGDEFTFAKGKKLLSPFGEIALNLALNQAQN